MITVYLISSFLSAVYAGETGDLTGPIIHVKFKAGSVLPMKRELVFTSHAEAELAHAMIAVVNL